MASRVNEGYFAFHGVTDNVFFQVRDLRFIIFSVGSAEGWKVSSICNIATVKRAAIQHNTWMTLVDTIIAVVITFADALAL